MHMNKTIVAVLIAIFGLLPWAPSQAAEPAGSETVSIAPLLKSAQPSETISNGPSVLALRTADHSASLDISALPEGTLLRDSISKKVYRFSQGQVTHIKSLAELRKFAGQPIITLQLELLLSQLAA